jgi:hypothetical protein
MTTVIQKIARLVQAYHNCIKTNNDYGNIHLSNLEKIEQNYLPSGSGFNSGTKIDIKNSKINKVILLTSYDNMDENGYYDKYLDYKIIIKPLFDTIDIQVIGSNYNQLKDYILQEFDYRLNELIIN